jgi:uncharacterized membrane protein HdeD (DUF308 family)
MKLLYALPTPLLTFAAWYTAHPDYVTTLNILNLFAIGVTVLSFVFAPAVLKKTLTRKKNWVWVYSWNLVYALCAVVLWYSEFYLGAIIQTLFLAAELFLQNLSRLPRGK